MKTINSFKHYSQNQEFYKNKLSKMGVRLINPQAELDSFEQSLSTELTPTQLEIALNWKAKQVHDRYKANILDRKDEYIHQRAITLQLKDAQEIRDNYCMTVGWEFQCYLLNRFRNNYDIKK